MMLVVSSVGAQQRQTQDLILQWGSTDVRYPRNEVPAGQGNKQWETDAWKGERVNAQAVLWTRQPLKNVRIAVSDLKCGKNVIPASATTTSFVGYVWTDELNKDRKSGCSDRPNKADWDSSLVADVLEVRKSLDIEAQCTQPLWVNIWVPQDIPSGVYKGALTVSGENFADVRLPMKINVQKRTLPDPAQWVFHLDLWQNPYAVARYYNVPLWSRQHFDIMKPLMQQLANAGQKVITASVMHHPWAGQTEDPFDSMVFRMKKIDGSWVYDYTVFDRWVEFMMSTGINRQINCYSMVPWELSFQYFDQASNTLQAVKTAPGEKEYEEMWVAMLKSFSKHLREKGWFDICAIAMDERPMEVMQKTLQVIRKADPEFKVSLAGNFHKELEADIYDYCIPIGASYPKEVLARRAQKQLPTTYYTCCTEAFPNTFTFSDPAEAAWMSYYSSKDHLDGYLRWAYNSWPKEPLLDSRFEAWAGGDTYLVYPGARSSIRFEKLIEGVQAHEKITILRKEFTDKKNKNGFKKLEKMLSTFKLKDFPEVPAAETVNKANKILNSL